jgi:hypothetical protein
VYVDHDQKENTNNRSLATLHLKRPSKLISLSPINNTTIATKTKSIDEDILILEHHQSPKKSKIALSDIPVEDTLHDAHAIKTSATATTLIPASGALEWSCDICTYLNSKKAAKCSMCGRFDVL